MTQKILTYRILTIHISRNKQFNTIKNNKLMIPPPPPLSFPKQLTHFSKNKQNVWIS